MKIAAMALVTIALAGSAKAVEIPQCREGSFSLNPKSFKLVRLRDNAPGLYDSWKPSCPWDVGKCIAKFSTFTAGRLALASHFHKGLACIVEIDPEGHEGHDGWVEVGHISMEPQPARPTLREWVGTWTRFEDEIVISRAGGGLKLKGKALWRGAYNTHDGEVEGRSIPRANHLLVEYRSPPDNCKLSLNLVGKYLVAADNYNCGGLNVTFRGIYFRQPAMRARAR